MVFVFLFGRTKVVLILNLLVKWKSQEVPLVTLTWSHLRPGRECQPRRKSFLCKWGRHRTDCLTSQRPGRREKTRLSI